MHIRALRAALLFVSFLIFPVLVSAGTVIHVPQDQPTIQAGITVAQNGDTVLVSAGTYKENINFQGKQITVTSVSGPAATIIDGGNVAAVASFLSGETNNSVLSGFTLQNGYNYGGGGVSVQYASPLITSNVIVANSCGAVYIYGGAPTFQDNIISNNTGYYCYSPAISVQNALGVQIIGNVISANSSSGVSFAYGSGGALQFNTIIDNRGDGVDFQPYGSGTLTMIQNLIEGNAGVGISTNSSAITAVNNTVANNLGGYGWSSEFFANTLDNQTTLENNLFISTGTLSAFSCGSYNYSTPPVFENNDVFAANVNSYGGQCPDLTGTNGNLSGDPYFVAFLSDNFHLQAGSPVIDVGNNAAPGLPAHDFDGDARIINQTVDMGVDEYSTSTTLTLSSYGLHFPATQLGSSSSPQSVTLTNHSTNSVNLNMAATGTDYTQTNNCGTSLASGASCQFSVVFTPVGAGDRNGVLAIFTGATGNPLTVGLSGTSLVPQVQTPCCFYFWGQVIGTTATQTGNVTNAGQAPLLISSIVYSGAADFLETNTCPIAPNTLAPGASCTVTVSFTPTIVGNESGLITFTDNAIPNQQTVSINGGSVSAGVPTLSPSSLTFPATVIGQSSAPQTVTLTNTGTGALGISNIYSYYDFQVTNNNCPASLAAGASCTFSVTFVPTQQGNENGNVYIYNDSPVWALVSVAGTGMATVPAITSLSLTSTPAGSPNTQVTITGSGFVWSSSVLWNGYQVPNSYTYGNTQITFTIPAADLLNSGTYQVSVYTPAPGGGLSNSLPFTVYTAINYAVKSVAYKYPAITGANLNLGYYSYATIQSPFPIQFGGGSFSTLTVGAGGTISFSGFASEYNAPIPTSQTTTLVAPFWANLYPFGYGQDNNVFWAATGTAPNRELIVEWRDVAYCCYSPYTVKFEVVFFEGSSNIQFNYADTVFGGSESGNDNGATATVGVQVLPTMGTQFSYDTPSLASKTSLLWYPSAPTATVSTNTLDFGYHKIGNTSRTQKFTLSNGGTMDLNISSVTISSPDFVQTNDCGSVVAAGASCTFLVNFNPSQPVVETATLAIYDNAANSPQTVTLSGIGAIKSIVIFPIKLNFGGVAVGQSLTLPVTLANAGNGKLTIQSITPTPVAFTQANNCGTYLKAGANCTINVTFTPAQAGSITGKLMMGLNGKAPASRVKLAGSGQ